MVCWYNNTAIQIAWDFDSRIIATNVNYFHTNEILEAESEKLLIQKAISSTTSCLELWKIPLPYAGIETKETKELGKEKVEPEKRMDQNRDIFKGEIRSNLCTSDRIFIRAVCPTWYALTIDNV